MTSKRRWLRRFFGYLNPYHEEYNSQDRHTKARSRRMRLGRIRLGLSLIDRTESPSPSAYPDSSQGQPQSELREEDGRYLLAKGAGNQPLFRGPLARPSWTPQDGPEPYSPEHQARVLGESTKAWQTQEGESYLAQFRRRKRWERQRQPHRVWYNKLELKDVQGPLAGRLNDALRLQNYLGLTRGRSSDTPKRRRNGPSPGQSLLRETTDES